MANIWTYGVYLWRFSNHPQSLENLNICERDVNQSTDPLLYHAHDSDTLMSVFETPAGLLKLGYRLALYI